MTEHHHDHGSSRTLAHKGAQKTSKRRIHKDWRTWVVVSFMLAAVLIYVLTLDDSMLWLAP